MKIGTRDFDIANHTYVMGILNVTPDSFSDGGKWNEADAALRHVEEMVQCGVDLVDIGGESTRPGYEMIPIAQEIERVCPVIEQIKARFDIPISLDTYKSAVAAAGIEAGADLINDIWGLKADPHMGEVIAEAGAACCLMHNRMFPAEGNFLDALRADLKETLELADQAKIMPERIILDPGVGFGKTYEQNLQCIAHLDVLHEFGLPILLGTSRKSVVGLTLDLPVNERLEGTLATTAAAVEQRAAFVRVHDVREHVRFIRMAEAIRDCR